MTYAAASGSAAAIEALHKHGAKPTANDLVLAASSCATPAVRALLAAGVGADAAAGGRTPLLAAAGDNCAEGVTVLLDRGANINARDGDGRTPLITATAGGFTEVVRVLLQRGADMDAADALERTAWMYAATRGKEDIAALFEAEKLKRKK
jgi:ankyrin repeat protein